MSALGPKKSLFSKPAWASTSTVDPVPKDNIFGRNEVYQDILEADRKKKERKEAKAKARAQADADFQTKLNEGRESKRRRISGHSDTDDSESEVENVKDTEEPNESARPRIREGVATRSTPHKAISTFDSLSGSASKSSPRNSVQLTTSVITLDSKDEHLDQQDVGKRIQREGTEDSDLYGSGTLPAKDKTTKSVTQAQVIDSESEEDDLYVRELKKKAREKAKAMADGGDVSKPIANAVPVQPNQSEKVVSRTASPDFEDIASPSPSKPGTDNDPEVSILIRSEIPGSKPIIVNRRASQPLQFVKDFWCKSFGFDSDFSSTVFFTWRGMKLFKATTMRAVLQQLKRDSKSDTDPSNGKIEIEAVTQEILDERRKRKERNLDNGNAEEGEMEVAGTQSAAPTGEGDDTGPKHKSGVVIRLTCQGQEPLSLRVRPHTSIGKIMKAFQKTKNIDPDKQCYLVFDGDRLEPNATAEELGFEDDDTLEVYLR